MRMHVSITTTHPIVVAIGRACPSWSLARFFLTSVTELQVKTSHVLLQMACRREALRALVAVMLTDVNTLASVQLGNTSAERNTTLPTTEI